MNMCHRYLSIRSAVYCSPPPECIVAPSDVIHTSAAHNLAECRSLCVAPCLLSMTVASLDNEKPIHQSRPRSRGGTEGPQSVLFVRYK